MDQGLESTQHIEHSDEEITLEVPDGLDNNSNMFLYSLVLPIVWFSFGALVHMVTPGKHLGMFGLLAVIYFTLFSICWHFARKYRRQFTSIEKFKLIVYFCLWAYFSELIGLLSLFNQQVQKNNITPQQVIFIVVITLVVDTVFLSLAVIFTARRMLKFFLDRQPTVA